MNKNINVDYHGNNFGAHAVVKHKKEAWVKMNTGRYFHNKEESVQVDMLSEVYDKCQAAIAHVIAAEAKESEPVTETLPEPPKVAKEKNKSNPPRKTGGTADEEAANGG